LIGYGDEAVHHRTDSSDQIIGPAMRSVLTLLVAVAALLAGTPAEAKKLCFGTDEQLRFIQKVDAKGPKGEPLELARKIRMECFIAPYTVYDDGFVLKVAGEDLYYSLTPERIAEMQKRNELPTPLPPFELSRFDQVFGHLIWIVVGVVLFFAVLDRVRNRRRRA
jgi:hypothetical protein